MIFPLSIWDISMLLAVTSLILLITAELLSPYRGKVNLKINSKRLWNTALIFSFLFIVTVAIRLVSTILNM